MPELPDLRTKRWWLSREWGLPRWALVVLSVVMVGGGAVLAAALAMD